MVDQNGNPVAGASASVTVDTPSGRTNTANGSTDINGLAYSQYRLSAAASLGVYTVSVTASAAGYAQAIASGSFTVS